MSYAYQGFKGFRFLVGSCARGLFLWVLSWEESGKERFFRSPVIYHAHGDARGSEAWEGSVPNGVLTLTACISVNLVS